MNMYDSMSFSSDPQDTDAENAQTAGDPNLVGAAGAVQDRRAGPVNQTLGDDRCPSADADWNETEFYRGR